LRLEPRPTDTFARRTQGFGWGTGDGAVAFDYGAKTIRCGAPLDEAEARIVVARLIQRDRRLSSEGAAYQALEDCAPQLKRDPLDSAVRPTRTTTGHGFPAA